MWSSVGGSDKASPPQTSGKRVCARCLRPRGELASNKVTVIQRRCDHYIGSCWGMDPKAGRGRLRVYRNASVFLQWLPTSSCALSAHSHAVGRVSFRLRCRVPAGFVQDPPPHQQLQTWSGCRFGTVAALASTSNNPPGLLLRAHSPDDGQNPVPPRHSTGRDTKLPRGPRGHWPAVNTRCLPPESGFPFSSASSAPAAPPVKHRTSGKWLLSSGCPCCRL